MTFNTNGTLYVFDKRLEANAVVVVKYPLFVDVSVVNKDELAVPLTKSVRVFT